MWDSCKSEYFQMYNGVKQGGVISCHLFNLYIDPLIVQLSNSDYGCHIAYNIYISCTMKHEVSKIKTRNELTYDQLALVKNLKTLLDFRSGYINIDGFTIDDVNNLFHNPSID